jgi:dolichyl-phosphate-mannose-protein mannosyltransferase
MVAGAGPLPSPTMPTVTATGRSAEVAPTPGGRTQLLAGQHARGGAASLRTRFTPAITGSPRLLGWLAPVAIALLALGLRLWRISEPGDLVFDETYYAKDAWSLAHFGYVREYVDDANEQIEAGVVDGLFTDRPAQVVHPEVGKWMIAAGERLMGMDPTGWRVAAAVTGALTVLVLARLVRRLTGSTLLGCTAGLLLTFDGLHLVMSRTALLDVFLTFWLVCAVACLVADRDSGRARLLRRFPESTAVVGFGPLLLWRPWRLAAGVCFGLAVGTKWSAVFVLAVFGLLVVAWDAGARRAIGVRGAWLRAALVDGVPAFVMLVVVAFVVYVLTWTGWLLHHETYEARYGFGYGETPPWGAYLDSPAGGVLGETVQALRSLWHFHAMNLEFHTGDYLAAATHPYQSNPQGWLTLNRPVGVAVTNHIPADAPGCDAAAQSHCIRQVLALGNPVLWWVAVPALVVSLWQWLARRDWRFAVPVLAVAAVWLPWFRLDDRPIFSFYAVALVPFSCMAVAMVAGVVLGPAQHDADGPAARRVTGAAAIVVLLAAVITCFAFFWPIWTHELITHEQWLRRIWFDAWI